ncbi:H-NS histone family protein (plasmid) [Burkholderia glumae]|uniref:H-NS histone family protein n=1 Tax=Burkholderia glumae TaxID=337 RepID=A0ABY5BAV9_BURGL|nr:H-NS histone family protein [Burkholderia glumae]USS44146.1 H-NS histone family protein [Burkholderia glumae]
MATKKGYPELLAERAALDEKIARARSEERTAALETIKQLMRDFGIDVSELRGRRGRKPTGPQPVKYRDAESGKTWSGRGRAPEWIAGKDRSAFEI